MCATLDTAFVLFAVCTLGACDLNDFGVLKSQNQVTDVTWRTDDGMPTGNLWSTRNRRSRRGTVAFGSMELAIPGDASAFSDATPG